MTATAPGKVILFGEHAVVYGEPSLSVALDRRIQVTAERAGKDIRVNDQRLDPRRHAYIHEAVRAFWDGKPVRLTTRSELPSASGVGSSAALTVATIAALWRLRHGTPPALGDLARMAFETELATQGAASPNDTTVATAGGAVLLAPRDHAGATPLWEIARGERVWKAQRIQAPPLPLVVANSGSRSRTADQVEKVRRLVESNPAAAQHVREIGRLTLQGLDALRAGDLPLVGTLMDQNHALLHELGVDTTTLARLCAVARATPGTYGAKLTGAGGGGSLIVLTSKPAAAARALEAEGAKVFQVTAAAPGVEVTA